MPTSTRRRTPQQARSRETVAVILEAAADVFAREGYDATTNRIAERAGVSVGSVYAYFPDKDALLTALADHHLDEVQVALHAAFDHVATAALDLAATVELLVRGTAALHEQQRGLHQVLAGAAPLPPATATRLEALLTELAARLAEVLVGLGVGGSRPALTARLVVEGLLGQVHGALLDDDPGARETATVVAIDLWVAALTHAACDPDHGDAR